MNVILEHLDKLLAAAAVGQLVVAGLNWKLESLLHWEKELARLPPLMREVFHVHKWFISIALVLFGVLTLRFSGTMGDGSTELGRWLAAGIGAFWLIRTGIQWIYYDRRHWQGNRTRTAVHWVLTLSYGGCSAVYLLAAFRP